MADFLVAFRCWPLPVLGPPVSVEGCASTHRRQPRQVRFMVFPIQSAEDEMGIEPDLRKSKCKLRFPDGEIARFARLMRSGQRGGYPLQVWY